MHSVSPTSHHLQVTAPSGQYKTVVSSYTVPNIQHRRGPHPHGIRWGSRHQNTIKSMMRTAKKITDILGGSKSPRKRGSKQTPEDRLGVSHGNELSRRDWHGEKMSYGAKSSYSKGSRHGGKTGWGAGSKRTHSLQGPEPDSTLRATGSSAAA